MLYAIEATRKEKFSVPSWSGTRYLESSFNFISLLSKSAFWICQFLNSDLNFVAQECQENLVHPLVVVQ